MRAPDPGDDPGELQRELAKLASSMNEATRTLTRMIEFQDLTNRATGDGLSRLRDLVADAAEVRAAERRADASPADPTPSDEERVAEDRADGESAVGARADGAAPTRSRRRPRRPPSRRTGAR